MSTVSLHTREMSLDETAERLAGAIAICRTHGFDPISIWVQSGGLPEIQVRYEDNTGLFEGVTPRMHGSLSLHFEREIYGAKIIACQIIRG